MRIRILGPLEVRHEQEWQRLGAPKWRSLLALLAIGRSRPHSVDRIVDELWPDRPPRGAVNQVHGYVGRLRRLLGDSDGEVLRTRQPGYELDLSPDDIDAARFEDLARQGETALRRNDVASARELLGEALDLWRGPALADVPVTATVQAEVERLEEGRLSTMESRIEADLALARHAELVAELQQLSAAHPYRERLWGQLMLALYRSGRQADALAAYHQLRRLLDDELGVEPTAALRDLHQQILRADPDLDVPAAPERPTVRPRTEAPPVVPHQLPAGVVDFTGREAELRHLDLLLQGEDPQAPDGLRIGTIAGVGGAGKTTLAVQWAHRVVDRFPDGELYASLRGFAPTPPREPIDVLAQFLRALGMPPDQVPLDEDEAAAAYRTLLSGRRVLVVLDNAVDAAQVRPLLPGSPGCVAVVTSRDRLGGLIALEGARPLELDRLGTANAVTLLGHILGQDRIQGEYDAAVQLAKLCDGLPLALRISGAYLLASPARSLAHHAEQLQAGDRLGALELEGDQRTAVRAVFDLSYDRLDPGAQRLFRLLGFVPGPDFGVDGATAIADIGPGEASRLLARLANAHLLVQRGADRYAFHDLMRLYALDRSAATDGDQHGRAAVSRLLRWYARTAREAITAWLPHLIRIPADVAATSLATDEQAADNQAADKLQAADKQAADNQAADNQAAARFGTAQDALDWLDAEEAGLAAAVTAAVDVVPAVAWLLADALRGYFANREHLAEWLSVAGAGRQAAAAESDGYGLAACSQSLAYLSMYTGDYPAAQEHGEAGRIQCERLGWREGEMAFLNTLAGVHLHQGQLDEATERFDAARAVARSVGDRDGEAAYTGNLGLVYLRMGRLDLALEHQTRAHELALAASSGRPVVKYLLHLGETHWLRGNFDTARTHLDRALDQLESLDQPFDLCCAYDTLANLDLDSGRLTQARGSADRALATARALKNPTYEVATLSTLASIELRNGRFRTALDQFRRAAEIARASDSLSDGLGSLLGGATAQVRLGRLADAMADLQFCVQIAQETGGRIMAGRATSVLAEVRLARGEPEAARSTALEALSLHQETGYRLGEALALRHLGDIARTVGDLGEARRRWQQAHDLYATIGVPEAAELRELLSTTATPNRA